MTPALRYEVVFVSAACRTAAVGEQITSFLFVLLFPQQLLTSHRCNNSSGDAPLLTCVGEGTVFKSVKLGVEIIQVEVEAILVVLDSELFRRRCIQTALHAYNPRWEPPL